MKLTAIRVLFVLIGVATSCAGSNETAKASSIASVPEVLREVNFGDFMASTSYAGVSGQRGTPGPMALSLSASNRKLVGKEILSNELTSGEDMLLGAWTLPGGNEMSLLYTISAISNYYRTNCCLPCDGSDLVATLAERGGIDRFLQLPEESQLQHAAMGVNPITGTFYSSFVSDEWIEGGMYVEIVEDPNRVEETFGNFGLPIDPKDPQGGTRSVDSYMHIKVYGERPDSIILEKNLPF